MFAAPDLILRLLDSRFERRTCLVIGDVMLDRYLWGEVSRISPEAPVPVLRVKRHSVNLGGAGNVARNLAELGLFATLIGVVGDDVEASLLRQTCAGGGMDLSSLHVISGRPTITKTRIVGAHQQMLRLDVEDTSPLPGSAEEAIIVAAEARIAGGAAAVFLSDYGKGVVSERVARAVIMAAQARHVPVLVDPKGVDYAKYAGATTVTPNLSELAAATAVDREDLDKLIAAGGEMRKRLGLDFLTFTRGEHGITVIEADHVTHIPAQAQDVFDVSGAGDSCIAVLGACLACGVHPVDATRLANLAGGIVVGKVGTVPVTLAELRDRTMAAPEIGYAGKVRTREQAAIACEAWRRRGQKVVFTNGCFDILHAGHVHMLEEARRAGDRLVVGLNADDSVRRLKGENRPVNNQADRASLLAALASVDAVVVFGEDTPLELIKTLKPDALVKGADYSEDQIVGAAEVRSWGGTIVRAQLLEGRSTTGTIGKMKG